MAKKNEEKNKPFTVRFKPSLNDKIEKYIKLYNSTKKPEDPKLDKTKFFNMIISNYFNHKVLSNDYITLDEPVYFNSAELLEKGSIICSLNKPTDLDNVQIVKRIPNNLDKLEKNVGTIISYYHNSYYRHKGILFSVNDFEGTGLDSQYLVFDYNSNSGEPELTISILKPEDLTAYLDIDKDKNIILWLQQLKKEFEEDFIEATEFYKEYDSLLEDNKLNEVPDEIKVGFSKIGFNVMKWYSFNYNCFIPVRLYSQLQQLLIFFNKATPEEAEKLEEGLGISKEELELYVETFEKGTEYNFNIFFTKLTVNEYNLDFNKMANDFVKNEDLSVLFKNNFLKE